MRREACQHENFFIAKNRDSESAQRAFYRKRRVATTSTARRSSNALGAKTPAAQSLLAMLTISGIAFARTVRIGGRIHRCVVEQRTPSVLRSACQHFLKWDAVFYHVLVYSGCSAFRFPSARSNKAISLHQEGNMAKKAKKAKKAKSAVKKTAKKTRKVAKKKK